MIANIVSKNSVNVPEDFNVVDSMDNIIHGLPTLIIGVELTELLYPDFDILDKCVEENVYWTFKKTEKRDSFNQDLDWFITKVYTDLIKNVNYVFIDLIQYRKQTLIKIVRKIHSLENIVTFVHNEMVYLYSDNIIFGLDLNLAKYMGMNVVKLKDKIKQISTDFLDSEEILIEYKNIVDILNGKIRIIPYLYSLRNGQNNITSFFHIPRKS
jgi:hypothetical protein